MEHYSDIDLDFVLEPWQQYEQKKDGRRVRFAVEEVRIDELRPNNDTRRPLKRKREERARQDFSTLLLASEFLRGSMPRLVASQ